MSPFIKSIAFYDTDAWIFINKQPISFTDQLLLFNVFNILEIATRSSIDIWLNYCFPSGQRQQLNVNSENDLNWSGFLQKKNCTNIEIMKLLNIALLYCSPSSFCERNRDKGTEVPSMSKINLEKNLTPGDHRHRH